jgi:hypothetical protein
VASDERRAGELEGTSSDHLVGERGGVKGAWRDDKLDDALNDACGRAEGSAPAVTSVEED